MHELPGDPDDLLALARRAQHEPEAEVRARVRRGVAGALVAGVAVSATAATGARVAAKAGWSGALAVKLAAGAAVCAVALSVLLGSGAEHEAAGERRAPAAVVASRKPAPAVIAPADAPSTAAPVPMLAGEAPASRTLTKSGKRERAAATSTLPSLRAELSLLEKAERAIDEDRPGRALTLLERHRARFVSSSFVEERQGLTLIARCMIDQPQTDGEAARFLSQAGGSVLHDRVKAACVVQP